MASIPDGAYNGTEVQFWFEGTLLYQQSSSGYYISGDPADGVTSEWFKKGPNGEVIEWYWDSSFKNPISLGDDIYNRRYSEFGTTLFVAIYGKRMDIKLKMGAKNSLPSKKEKGTVYFAKDGDKNFGELYYDDENGNRVKIGGTNISNLYFSNHASDEVSWLGIDLTMDFEDGTSLTSGYFPVASRLTGGIIAPTTNLNSDNKLDYLVPMPVGIPEFFPGIALGVSESMGVPSMILSGGYNNDNIIAGVQSLSLAVSDTEFNMGAALTLTQNVDGSTIMAETDTDGTFYLTNYFWTNCFGSSEEAIPEAYIEELTASSILSDIFTGDLDGNAETATSWFNSIVLNDTEVKGGEAEAITTAKWGAERNISISGTAGTTGTSIDGSSEDGYTLIIPATMTNFTSITSTDLLATNLGSATAPITTSHFKETYFYNPDNTNYKHKLTSNAGSADCQLQLPNTSGLLVSKPNATASVGDTNSPVYVAINGEVTACTTIAVDHGGTGANTFAAGTILCGNGTSAFTTVSPTTKGRILVANGNGNAPLYASPTLSFTTGTDNPKVKIVINEATYESATGIQSATASNPGIVSTVAQTFAGNKTFNGAVTVNGLTSTTGIFSGQINANADIRVTGKIKSNSSGSSHITLADDRTTVTSPILHLNGTSLILNSNNYGSSLPTEGLEEGRIFFLLTPEE